MNVCGTVAGISWALTVLAITVIKYCYCYYHSYWKKALQKRDVMSWGLEVESEFGDRERPGIAKMNLLWRNPMAVGFKHFPWSQGWWRTIQSQAKFIKCRPLDKELRFLTSVSASAPNELPGPGNYFISLDFSSCICKMRRDDPP